jgi:two-component system cell cycle response regulator DivK
MFDDDRDILELCTLILTRKNYEVFTDTTCITLLNTVDAVQPDIIIMDNWIPEHGGIDATQQLKASEQYKHIPVIYFSANADIHLLAEKAGADTYLAKPFDIEELEKIVADTLARHKLNH